MDTLTEKEVRRALAKERRNGLVAAQAFITACAGGDPDELLYAADLLSNTVGGWRPAMRGVAKLREVSPSIQGAFLSIWVQHLGSRTVLARALRRLMPAGYAGPLLLYRGAGGRERSVKAYGFSWTKRADVARQFAEHWRASDRGGVVFQTEAPAHAILLVREDGESYDEGEVVLDPFALTGVRTIEVLS